MPRSAILALRCRPATQLDVEYLLKVQALEEKDTTMTMKMLHKIISLGGKGQKKNQNESDHCDLRFQNEKNPGTELKRVGHGSPG